MPNEPLQLFYCYAREDAKLLKHLDEHLTTLKRDLGITEWHDGNISAGDHWEEEIHLHLASAHIILLLISSSFLTSNYCYNIEMKKALEKHASGTACVIPILLRECDWQIAPLRQLQALPRNGKPVTIWPDIDAAFTDVVGGIREATLKLGQVSPIKADEAPAKGKRSTKGSQVIRERNTEDDTKELSIPLLKKAIEKYYKELHSYQKQAHYEQGIRVAFHNLLVETARMVGWTLTAEYTLENNIRPDGLLRDGNSLHRGHWEAKGPKGNLDREIEEKIKKGYPLRNILFENSRRAVLYQGNKRVLDCDMQQLNNLSDLLRQFLTYTEPHIEKFQTAVVEFKQRLPELAHDLQQKIEGQHQLNKPFIAAFNNFATICRSSLDANLSKQAMNEMLVQHLLTERIFRTIFDNPDFVSRNVIAAEIEKVIKALIIDDFTRSERFKDLDRYYGAIEGTAKGIESWTERQEFLNTVYEGFFQGFSVKQADTHGIVYTPQEIVDFMCTSVDEVLNNEFGTSLETPGVKILDPATGTGNFIVNLIKRMASRDNLREKYAHDLFCNEIMLLPYYIASLNIEHEYYDKMGKYAPFEGLCFADTLELAEVLHTHGSEVVQQSKLFMVEANTQRVEREKAAEIMVVIGNPPYNVGQKSENDNNKNRRYPVVDQRIRETYAKDSKASNKNALFDAYVKFFRWASDRLQGCDGIVCFVSNNGFLDAFAFDGFRKQLADEFSCIYHLNLAGNARKGEGGNVFDIMVSVGITLAVRSSKYQTKRIRYYCVPKQWRKGEKLAFLREKKHISNIEWLEIQPDKEYTWLTEGLKSDFSTFIPVGIKALKSSLILGTPAIFSKYGCGVKTNRDTWTYDFSCDALETKIKLFTDAYNGQVDRWRRRGNSAKSVDDFVTYDDTKIKWSEGLKLNLRRGNYADDYNDSNVRQALYRPFCKQWLYFDRILIERVYQFPQFLPKSDCELENAIIVVSDIGYRSPFSTLATNVIPDLHLLASTDAYQCFPYYTYAEDGTNRRENITDWALKQFQDKYGPAVTKWYIFHYVYAILHHPQYRECYKENLKRSLPHIPLVQSSETFSICSAIGARLMKLHIYYETVQAYDLKVIDNNTLSYAESRRVEKMRLTSDRTAVLVNKSLTLAGIPQECFEYRLGNRSALEWVLDQYQVVKDKQGTVISDPNRMDDEEYILRLVKQVVAVSVQTVRLVNELTQAVREEDWLDDLVKL